MKMIKRLSEFLIIISILIILPQISFGIPMKINYQGFLKNKNNEIINSSVSIQFSLYNSEDSNESIWTELHENVLVNEGIFNVVLGEISTLNGSLFDDDLYLGIRVGNDPEMKPRCKFYSVAFAIKSSVAQSLSGNLNGNQIIDRTIDITKLNFVDDKGNYQIEGSITIEGGISIKELRPDISPETDDGYGKVYAKDEGVDYQSSSSLINSLVLYWKMDKSNGNQIIDSSGSNHGLAFENPVTINGKQGIARQFNRDLKQYISIENNKFEFNYDSFTIAFWMRSKRPSAWTVIMSKSNSWDGSDQACGWIFGNTSGSNSPDLEFTINSCGVLKNYKQITASNIFDDQWHHVIGIKDNDKMRLYIDGKQEGNDEQNVTQSVSTNEPFTIGSMADYFYYSGAIDEVAIWNRALTENEITGLFNNGDYKGIPYSGKKLYYKSSDGKEIALNGLWKKIDNNVHLDGGKVENVKIGTNEIKTNLEVSGIIKPGQSNQVCNEEIEGAIKYNYDSKTIEFCNGEQWIEFKRGCSNKTFRSCYEIMQSGCSNGSGTYEIHSDLIDNSFLVYCDMFTDGGGWTLIALNDQTTTFTNFNKNWNEYKNGFGNLSSKQLGWLGNDKIHALTNEGNKTLMVKTDSNVHKYNSFKIDNESNKYKMTFDDSPLSNDGNQFTNHNNKFFSTYDRDNDSGGSNCASQYKSGWWFNACYYMTIAGNSNNKVYWQNSSGTLYYVDWIEMWIK